MTLPLIYKSVDIHAFREAFRVVGEGEAFSCEGYKALFDYLEDLAESTDTPIELDPIGICCEYTEYETFEALQADYADIESIEELADRTRVIKINDNSFIVQAF